MAVLPGLVRCYEVAAGEIKHALRFTAPRTRREYVWPARHFASEPVTIIHLWASGSGCGPILITLDYLQKCKSS